MPTFDGPNLLIILDSGVTDVDVEVDLYSEWKEWMQLSDNAKYPPAFRTVGGDALTPGIDAGAYFFLQNQDGWRLKPPEEDITVYITGNLAPEEASNPLSVPTDGAFTAYLVGLQPITQSVEQILAQQAASTVRLQHMIAAQDETHSPFGNVWYWDPYAGDDTADGTLPQTARATFASIQTDLITGTTRDMVIILARDPAGTTLITERITITKHHVLLAGPGRLCCFRPTEAGGDTITVDGASGVEIDSIRVQTHTTGTRNAITVTNGASHCKISNVYADAQTGEAITGDALNVVGGDHHIIQNMYIENATGDGVYLEDVVSARVEGCKIFSSGQDGLRITASVNLATNHASLNDNVIQQSVGYDLNIDTAFVHDTAIRFLNDITDSLNLQDLGTETQWERLNQAQFAAFQTWEEVAGDHLVPGTVGFNAASQGYMLMGSIHIDTVNGVSGTTFGVNGTAINPVDSLADAVILAAAGGGITSIFLENGTINLDQNFDGWKFLGGVGATINLNSQSVSGTSFENLTIQGDGAGSYFSALKCYLNGPTNIGGVFSQCQLDGTISLAPGTTLFTHCVSFVPGSGTPVLNVQGAGRSFQFRQYSGGLQVQNMSDSANAGSIELVGQVILDNTLTDGELSIRGTYKLTDNSAGTVLDIIKANSTSADKSEIKQAWTRAITGGSKLRATVVLEINGQVIALPGTATLDVVVRDAAGAAVISQTGLTPNPSGYFQLTEDPYVPSVGVNLASFATITDGSDVYQSVTPLSFPEFS